MRAGRVHGAPRADERHDVGAGREPVGQPGGVSDEPGRSRIDKRERILILVLVVALVLALLFVLVMVWRLVSLYDVFGQEDSSRPAEEHQVFSSTSSPL